MLLFISGLPWYDIYSHSMSARLYCGRLLVDGVGTGSGCGRNVDRTSRGIQGEYVVC